MNSREKGKRGEREFASVCRENGYDCRRGQQFSGIEGEDVVGLPGIHIEVKRVERLNIEDAMAQSKRDTKDEEKPIVAHRKNNCDWLITMRAADWFELFREWEAGRDFKNEAYCAVCEYRNTGTCITGIAKSNGNCKQNK